MEPKEEPLSNWVCAQGWRQCVCRAFRTTTSSTPQLACGKYKCRSNWEDLGRSVLISGWFGGTAADQNECLICLCEYDEGDEVSVVAAVRTQSLVL